MEVAINHGNRNRDQSINFTRIDGVYWIPFQTAAVTWVFLLLGVPI